MGEALSGRNTVHGDFFFGLSLAFIPLSQGALLKERLTFHTLVAPTLLTSGGVHPDAAADTAYFEMGTTIATIAFIGSFISALMYVVRAIANIDLVPLTFLRVTLNMLLAMATALVLWRTVPDIYGALFAGAGNRRRAHCETIRCFKRVARFPRMREVLLDNIIVSQGAV